MTKFIDEYDVDHRKKKGIYNREAVKLFPAASDFGESHTIMDNI